MSEVNKKILFVGGPSGAGKGFLGENLRERGWLHLEIDQHEKDGIDLLGLREPWNTFYLYHNPHYFNQELQKRIAQANSTAAIVTYSSTHIFAAEHQQTMKNWFKLIYLYGSPADCLKAFLQREASTGRNLDQKHWNTCNQRIYGELALSHNHKCLVPTFNADGSRKSFEYLLSVINFI